MWGRWGVGNVWARRRCFDTRSARVSVRRYAEARQAIQRVMQTRFMIAREVVQVEARSQAPNDPEKAITHAVALQVRDSAAVVGEMAGASCGQCACQECGGAIRAKKAKKSRCACGKRRGGRQTLRSVLAEGMRHGGARGVRAERVDMRAQCTRAVRECNRATQRCRNQPTGAEPNHVCAWRRTAVCRRRWWRVERPWCRQTRWCVVKRVAKRRV